jgi:hypothetical protein
MDSAIQQKIISLGLCAMVVFGLIVSAFYIYLAAVFFENFNFANMFHIFALLFTLVAPVCAFAGLIIYHFRPNRVTALVSLLSAILPFGTVLVWSSDSARGLIH